MKLNKSPNIKKRTNIRYRYKSPSVILKLNSFFFFQTNAIFVPFFGMGQMNIFLIFRQMFLVKKLDLNLDPSNWAECIRELAWPINTSSQFSRLTLLHQRLCLQKYTHKTKQSHSEIRLLP